MNALCFFESDDDPFEKSFGFFCDSNRKSVQTQLGLRGLLEDARRFALDHARREEPRRRGRQLQLFDHGGRVLGFKRILLIFVIRDDHVNLVERQ